MKLRTSGIESTHINSDFLLNSFTKQIENTINCGSLWCRYNALARRRGRRASLLQLSGAAAAATGRPVCAQPLPPPLLPIHGGTRNLQRHANKGSHTAPISLTTACVHSPQCCVCAVCVWCRRVPGPRAQGGREAACRRRRRRRDRLRRTG